MGLGTPWSSASLPSLLSPLELQDPFVLPILEKETSGVISCLVLGGGAVAVKGASSKLGVQH